MSIIEAIKPVDESEVKGVSPWLLLMRQELGRLSGRPIFSGQAAGFSYTLCHSEESLWIIATSASKARVAYCVAYSFGPESKIVDRKVEDNKCTVRMHTVIGEYVVQVEMPTSAKPVLHWKTALQPSTDLTVPFWPRDVIPLDDQNEPSNTRGVIHASQVGPNGNLLYASMTKPQEASLLYVQDLGSLTEYFEQTQTKPSDRIGGTWPELGFSLPLAPDKPLDADREYTISDAFVVMTEEVPTDDLTAPRMFLDLYAEIYLAIDKPHATYRDWPRRVDETIRDLTHSPQCGQEVEGHRYMLAYACSDDRPPESMVQLAVLVPLSEYARSREVSLPLCKMLSDNLPNFYDKEVSTVVRWLPAKQDLLVGKEEHMQANVMDSWYLWHTLMNLARMAEMGDKKARKLFMDSIESGIETAQRFDYRWPVFYDINTREIIKAESKPGEGGEHDVGALYAHVMLQAFSLTKDRRYVDEAVKAATKLRGLGFKLGYQFNNVSFGGGALFKLWKETSDEQFRGLSDVCWAIIVRNFWLWDCNYGYAKHYTTFMGLPPLPDAVYLALYEELEVLAAIHDYLKTAGDDVPAALRILLPEYCKYVVDRAWYHYPSELPRDMLAEKPNSGILNRHLSVPLEDIYEGWEKAGQVGQEVYGAAAPFIIVSRHCHRIPGESFNVHIDYPIGSFESRKTKVGGRVTLRALGDRRCRCHLRVVPGTTEPLPAIKVSIRVGDSWNEREGCLCELGYLEFELPGNVEARVDWRHNKGAHHVNSHNGKSNGRRV